MEVRVEVIGNGPYQPGTAHVYVDGREVAKLRACESVTVTSSETVSTDVDQPLGLKARTCPACDGGDGALCADHAGCWER